MEDADLTDDDLFSDEVKINLHMLGALMAAAVRGGGLMAAAVRGGGWRAAVRRRRTGRRWPGGNN
jgi:hypothetical protein